MIGDRVFEDAAWKRYGELVIPLDANLDEKGEQ